jgi:hypothetical protein
VLPDPFNGEGSCEQWSYHFDNVAAVNGLEAGDKLKWLKVRLTGRAQTAFQRLPDTTRADIKLATKALKERFEPSSRKTRYQAELQVRKKKSGESWADLAEDLRLLADKAYPDLEDNARERLALNAYLSQIENPHVAFGVKQKTPANLDAAVTATLELESYWSPRMMTVAGVELDSEATPRETASCGAVSQKPSSVSNEEVASMVEKLMEKIDRLETKQHQQEQGWRSGGQDKPNGADANWPPRRRDTRTCWSCGKTGHIARQCRSRRSHPEN